MSARYTWAIAGTAIPGRSCSDAMFKDFDSQGFS